AVLVVCAQWVGATGMVLDAIRGNYNDRALSSPYYNDLASLQNALHEADEVAQQQQLQRVYVAADTANVMALTFLAEQMHTPTTVFDGAFCAALPAAEHGPAVLLIGPRSQFVNALVHRFTQTTLADQPHRSGGPPFQLYVVNAPGGSSIAHGTFQ